VAKLDEIEIFLYLAFLVIAGRPIPEMSYQSDVLFSTWFDNAVDLL
jgi:hypothetical protein